MNYYEPGKLIELSIFKQMQCKKKKRERESEAGVEWGVGRDRGTESTTSPLDIRGEKIIG